MCEHVTREWRKGLVRVSGKGGGEGSTICTIYYPLRRQLARRILISVRAYHDELIQHGDVLELRIAIEKQSSMICIGQSLFVQCLTKQNKTKQGTEKQDIMISSATIILSYFSLISTNGEKICWSKRDQWQLVFIP